MLPILEAQTLGFRWRPGPYKAHVAFENAEKLRQFIQREFSEPATNGRDPGVIPHLEGRAAHLVELHQRGFEGVRVGNHGAEFVSDEWFPIFAQHSPVIENRAAR